MRRSLFGQIENKTKHHQTEIQQICYFKCKINPGRSCESLRDSAWLRHLWAIWTIWIFQHLCPGKFHDIELRQYQQQKKSPTHLNEVTLYKEDAIVPGAERELPHVISGNWDCEGKCCWVIMLTTQWRWRQLRLQPLSCLSVTWRVFKDNIGINTAFFLLLWGLRSADQSQISPPPHHMICHTRPLLLLHLSSWHVWKNRCI